MVDDPAGSTDSILWGMVERVARKWHYDVSDIRSAMVEGALEAWFSRDTMLARAFTSARELVKSGSSETCATGAECLFADAAHEEDSTLRATSIIDASTVRDPDADERIRGERTGALLQRMGVMEHVTPFMTNSAAVAVMR